jgi:diguanylate cyclase (GGDEF)-like protein
MASQRSQVIVVSNDGGVIQACRRSVVHARASSQLRHVHRPERLPRSIGLNDWLLIDTDNEDLNRREWSERLCKLSGQILATGTGRHRLSEDYAQLGIRRFLTKADLERQLTRLLSGLPQREPSGSGEWIAWPKEGEAHPESPSGLTLAHRVACLAEQISSFDTHRVAEVALERISALLEARLSSLYALDERQHLLVLVGHTHPYVIDARIDMDRQARRPMVRAARSRRICVARNRKEAADLLGGDVQQHRCELYGTESFIIAPLTAGERLVGVFNLADPVRGESFAAHALELVQPLCRLIATAMNNARVFQEVQHQARTDALTGLPNRRTFMEQLVLELHRARRYSAPLSLALIDVDGLKGVNDTHGHPAGDALLCEVALRIRRTIREIDLPARYGGDEFAVILPSTNLEQARRVANRLTEAVAHRPSQRGHKAIGATLSVGVCQYEHESTAQDLISAADASLYAAKARGRNCVAAATA